MKKVLLVSIMLMVFISMLSGCTGKTVQENTPTPSQAAVEPVNTVTPSVTAEKNTYPMKITDAEGNVTTFDKEPERVISLSPNITEIVYALGKGDTLVGRTAFCNYPEQALEATVVGDFIEWNMETIVALEPDVVFASALNTDENEKKLKDLGIHVVFLTQNESFDSVYETIDMVGKVLNAQTNAEQIVTDMKTTVSDVTKAVEGLKRQSVYYVVGYGEYGDYTATGETFIASALDMAGGDNIAADITGWVYSLEKLMENDPYIILGPEEVKDDFVASNGYKELTAVKEGRFYSINRDLLERQGPRLSEGLKEVAKILHPEAFQ